MGNTTRLICHKTLTIDNYKGNQEITCTCGHKIELHKVKNAVDGVFIRTDTFKK